MSLYAVTLRFPFTGTKGSSLNHEKQPQTIIPPPPNFTVCIMHSGRWRSPGIRQPQICPLDCQMVKRDSSLQTTHYHCSGVQCRQALHHSSQRMVMLGGRSAMETHFTKLPTNSSCSDIASRGSVATEDRQLLCATRFSTRQSCSLSLCGIPLHS